MNMWLWVPEANFYRQPLFVVSCQIITWTSSQLYPGHNKADPAKNRIWVWGRDKISESHSEVYITYILYCFVQSWGHALPTVLYSHISFQSVSVASSHLKEYIWLLKAYRSTSSNKARSRTGRELKTRKPGLGREKEEVNRWSQTYPTSQFSPVWAANIKLLVWRTCAVQRFPSRQPLSDNTEINEWNG